MGLRVLPPLESVDGHITSETYLRLLEIVVKPEMDASRQLNRVLVSQQDNAKALKIDAAMDYWENWEYEVVDWPPHSPDLFPIKNIRNVMKMKMKAH